MRVYYDFGALPQMGPAVLTIGAFDGVHAGHRQLVARTAKLAAEHGARAVAITFWPHPAQVLRPEEALSLLSTLDEKLELLAGLNALDAVVVQPFTPELAQRDPESYLDAQRQWCEPRALVEGPDFALGHNRAGTVAYLRDAGARRGFAVETVAFEDDGVRVSSTRIRDLLREGHVDAAARLLARPYAVAGEVVEGDKRGRLLGFPTANLRTSEHHALPASGVYAVRVRLPGEREAAHPAVANLGVRPTFGGPARLLLEVHLLGVTMDLYGLTIGVEWIARLREERRFDGIDALKAQIALDAQRAASLLKDVDAGTEDRSMSAWA